MKSDVIYRQAAIDEIDKMFEHEVNSEIDAVWNQAVEMASNKIKYDLPPAQPEAIPLEWITKHLEWLDNCDNDFAQLAKVGIRAMVEIWRKEKTQSADKWRLMQ